MHFNKLNKIVTTSYFLINVPIPTLYVSLYLIFRLKFNFQKNFLNSTVGLPPRCISRSHPHAIFFFKTMTRLNEPRYELYITRKYVTKAIFHNGTYFKSLT